MEPQAIHPPQTIVDVASIVHEMRVMKSAEELEIMQTAADIAAEARRSDESRSARYAGVPD